jgi:hypothetical protein
MTEQTRQPTYATSPKSTSDYQSELKVTSSMIESLRATKPWAQLLAILGFIAAFFMVFSGLFSYIGFSQVSHRDMGGPFPFFLISLVNVLMGVLYLIPSYLLLKYATAIGRLLDGGGQHSMEQALSYQKSFWKFVGILGLISMVFALLGIAAAIAIPLLANLMH